MDLLFRGRRNQFDRRLFYGAIDETLDKGPFQNAPPEWFLGMDGALATLRGIISCRDVFLAITFLDVSEPGFCQGLEFLITGCKDRF